MNKILKIGMFLLFTGALIFTPIIYYTIKATNSADSEIVKAIDFDLNEKRGFSEFKYTNLKNFPKDFENYFNDHIPFRSFFIQTKRDIESFVERPYVNGLEEFLMGIGKEKKEKSKKRYIVLNEKYMDYPVKQFTNHALMPDEEDEVTDDEYPLKTMKVVILGRKNWLFYNSDNIEYYTGKNILKDNEYESYIKKYEELDELCKRKGKKMIFLIIPEKERIYGEYMPTMERVDTVGKIKRIQNYVSTASNINFIYPYEEMTKRKQFYRVYKKFDSHYNFVGAYLTHNEILKKDNKEIIDIDDTRIDKIPCQSKDLVWLSGQSETNYMNDFDYYIYYKEDVKVTPTYVDYNASGDVNTWAETFESDVDNDDKVLFYGDSFKENLKSYLPKDYKRITFVGTLNPKKKKVINENIRDSNIIILEGAERHEKGLLASMMYELSEALLKLPDVEKDETTQKATESKINR